MEFNREELEQLVSRKLALAERSVVRAYLNKCSDDPEEIETAIEEFISSRAEHGVQALSQQLEESLNTRNQLEKLVAEKCFELAVNSAVYSLGVKNEFCEDVKLLASHAITAESSQEDITQAVASVVERIPAFLNDSSEPSSIKPDFAGHRGNFARKEDSAALLQNRLNSARASGDNALSVAIISEAAELGVSLR